jgi:hypothetical protein
MPLYVPVAYKCLQEDDPKPNPEPDSSQPVEMVVVELY